VSFRKPQFEAVEIVRKLRALGIITAARAGWVRTSPHFYNSPSDIDRLLEALP
jgi:selenocysteine lyase/cysteine desulfurase